MDSNTLFKQLADLAKTWDGKVYLVGGAVRDQIMGKESKDLDFVITKINLDELSKKLKLTFPNAKVDEVGKSFGIIKMNLDGEDLDFAIPRSDIDRDNVKTDPNIPIEKDLERRDYTINALAKNLENGDIVSPEGYDGVKDIKDGVLRAVGNPEDRFKEDPLRILRGISQAARFNFIIDPKTLEAMKNNKNLLKNVSSERFYDEFFKGWTKGHSNVDLFTHYILQTGIGSLMFGDDFRPIILDFKGSPGERFLATYIAWFLNGGDYKKLNLKVNEQEYVELAKTFKDFIENKINLEQVGKKIGKHGDKFDFIIKVFNEIDETLSKKLQTILNKPLIPQKETANVKKWELPISTGDIIQISNEINKPIKGKEIQLVVNDLIEKYQKNELTVEENKLKNYEIIKNYLNTFLNKDINNLQSKINEILYK